MKNTIDFKNTTDLIKKNYGNQSHIQMPIYLFIDLEKNIIYADTYNYDINGIPIKKFNGKLLSFELPPNVNAIELKTWVDENILNLNTYDNVHILIETVPIMNGGLCSPEELLDNWIFSVIKNDTSDEEIQSIVDNVLFNLDDNYIIEENEIYDYIKEIRDDLVFCEKHQIL